MDADVIPAVSIGISSYNTQQTVDTSLLKDTMNMSQQSTAILLQSLETNLGQLMDAFA